MLFKKRVEAIQRQLEQIGINRDIVQHRDTLRYDVRRSAFGMPKLRKFTHADFVHVR